MARSVETIQKQILDNIAVNSNLQALTSTSTVAIYRLIAYVIAFVIHTHELLFDIHVAEVNSNLEAKKYGSLGWYKTISLAFQYGFGLVQDKDYFDNGSATEDEIDASKMVKYVAVEEPAQSSRLIIKIAGEVNNVLAPLEPDVLESFIAYIEDVKVTGEVTVINYLPDILYLKIQIQRDALVLDANGMSILNGNYPVIDAINEYLKELDFNGELKLSHLVDKLQVVKGVKDATVLSAQSSWIDVESGGYGEPVSIFIKAIPISGYYKVSDFNNISYVV